VYHAKSAEERERVSQELAKYKLDGVDFGLPPTSARDLNTLVFPLARLRKITKLDPDVKGLSKEALLLITKCAEMVTTKLGQETVKVAQLQNRRKLLPEDVAQVCATREQFLFLREDVKDLMKEQHLHNKKALEKKKGEVATVSAKPFADFFASK
jgi:histone H3/H4